MLGGRWWGCVCIINNNGISLATGQGGVVQQQLIVWNYAWICVNIHGITLPRSVQT